MSDEPVINMHFDEKTKKVIDNVTKELQSINASLHVINKTMQEIIDHNLMQTTST